jgi:hypothetical protein
LDGKGQRGGIPDENIDKGHTESSAAEVLKMLEENPYGFSYRPIDKTSPTKGYMTSIEDGPIFDPSLPREEKLAMVNDFLDKKDSLLGEKDYYVGGWHNQEDGKFYLDASKNFQDLNETVSVSLPTHQKSIYHLPDIPGEDGEVIWMSDFLDANPDFPTTPEIREYYKIHGHD